MNIGQNIKKIRQLKGMAQEEMSKNTGIPQASLSKIESGQDFLWSRLIKIAEALHVEVRDIVCLDTSKITFNLLGDRAKGVIINQATEHEVIRTLREENIFLRKMLDKTITKLNHKK
jgi:transcriptional regulator with XRE-family HTH domain